MLVRDFTDTDLDAVVSVYNAARAMVECFGQADVSSRTFRPMVRNEEILLAVADQKIIGFVSIWAPEKFIHHLYVDPEHQKKGAANSLISACVEQYGLPLSLKSLTANANACRYYECNHWVVEETGRGRDGNYNHYWLRDEDS